LRIIGLNQQSHLIYKQRPVISSFTILSTVLPFLGAGLPFSVDGYSFSDAGLPFLADGCSFPGAGLSFFTACLPFLTDADSFPGAVG